MFAELNIEDCMNTIPGLHIMSQSCRYKLTMATDWSTLPRPIYRSKKGAKFEQWVSTFTGYLTSKVGWAAS